MRKVPGYTRRSFRIIAALWCGAALLVLLTAGVFAEIACPYRNIQVLLPGEFPAPGTETGKTGTPRVQIVGIPCPVVVRVCDGQWNTVESVRHVIRLTTTDGTADLPAAAPLINGELTLPVTFNRAGSFTVTAEDLTDYEHRLGVSSPVTVMEGEGELSGFVFSSLGTEQYAGSPAAVELAAVDQRGNRVTAFAGPVILEEVTSTGQGRLSPAEVYLEEGFWSGSVTLFLADETTISGQGAVRLYASLEENQALNGYSNRFTVHPGDFSRLQIVVPGQRRSPGTITGITGSPAVQSTGLNLEVEVYATDPYWNLVEAADLVRIVSSDPTASTPVGGSLQAGQGRFALAFGRAGTHTLTVIDESDGGIEGMTSEGIPVISSEPTFVIEPIPSPVTAG
ncbi:MAG: hypothetical protein JXB45_11425, partial [Candidatus Krumholzibacteriota bacterium]|nr:hypothetical protein [Candidatus Krumholzibacteriota bacterium]